ncbi:hypothetical protein BST27_18545 [Mycobacterium intermedium]|uniref:Uncharacterized protein n=1 Tax=Mycobacterium intermedium TaxID=28445 RepID=A0A1E3SEU9_MYCIE|nr:hypothetical protein [Mycobacterium intermedium]MCV6963082.1 hypothetical protein [Mycobacterium intermedium]ODR00679.1 hypothetical protein BHQ20_11855 [Mycobacterium intermedium]OPE52297.1 hypothetical protein BV508_02835 [Mycobacterium intermedium]ORB00263.1 hypothetical protein BST27_18545 [Mycobacterium intermedium]
MTTHPDIVIVCDHGREGDGRIELDRCDLVAPILWADDDQGWLPQPPVIASYLDGDDRVRGAVGQPYARGQWTRLKWEFICPKYTTGAIRTCTREPVALRQDSLQTLCERLSDSAFVVELAESAPHTIAVQMGIATPGLSDSAVVLTLHLFSLLARNTPGK